MNKMRRHTKKVLIAIVGGLVVLVGLVLVPYPGPGWLIVFGGLAILATEFEFASKVLEYAKGKYDSWVNWIKRQNIFIRVIVLALTGMVVLLTIWLVNGFGILNSILSFDQEWLVSPFLR
ncbi:MAG: TIGR02611 family protein [Patescibacteria group bacterium]